MTTKATTSANWISSLTDKVLKADFTAFGSSITEIEMAQALTDLANELKSSNKTLSSSQLADLKLIAANIAAMGASSYLQFVPIRLRPTPTTSRVLPLA
jgi:hypothetical protein